MKRWLLVVVALLALGALGHGVVLRSDPVPVRLEPAEGP
jgi:hypothetical protein